MLRSFIIISALFVFTFFCGGSASAQQSVGFVPMRVAAQVDCSGFVNPIPRNAAIIGGNTQCLNFPGVFWVQNNTGRCLVLTANDNGTALPVQTLRNGVLHNVVVISGNQRLSCLPHGRTAYIYGGNDNTVSATALTVGTVPIELAPTPVGEPNIVINSYAAEAGGNSLAPVSAWGACGRNGAVLSTYVDSGIRGVIINPSSCKAF